MNNQSRTTISQIAEEAGVSKQTVSRVLNNRPDVAPHTRQHVQDIIDRKGYRPSNLARGLTQGRSYIVGVIMSPVQQFGPSQILTGIESETRKLDYSLYLDIVYEVNEQTVTAALSNMVAQQVDGVLWSSMPRVEDSTYPLSSKLKALGVPVVVIGTKVEGGLSAIMIDNCLGAVQATRHLIDQGYHTIGLITGDMMEWSAQQRMNGWQKALLDASLSADPSLIVAGDWSSASGASGLQQLIVQRPDIDAVFACNDQMALGVLKAADELGLQVPEELGVVGFDDTPEASFFIPSLTTVRHPLVQSGTLATAELDRQITVEFNGGDTEPQTIVLPTELVIRASSSRVRAASAIEREAEGERLLA